MKETAHLTAFAEKTLLVAMPKGTLLLTAFAGKLVSRVWRILLAICFRINFLQCLENCFCASFNYFFLRRLLTFFKTIFGCVWRTSFIYFFSFRVYFGIIWRLPLEEEGGLTSVSV